MEKSKKFLELLIPFLVKNEDEIKIESRTDELGVLITLKVSKEDMGNIIGKQGATAQALRTLLRIVGMSEKSRVNLKIEEPDEHN